MKLNKTLLLILTLIIVNIALLIIVRHQKVNLIKNMQTCQDALHAYETKNKLYFNKPFIYNPIIRTLLTSDIEITQNNTEFQLLSEVKSQYKIIVFVPKLACKSCVQTMFKLIKENKNLKAADFLIISNFYTTKELDLYKKVLDLPNYSLFRIINIEKLKLLKDPVFFASKNNAIFVFDINYQYLLNTFLNNI